MSLREMINRNPVIAGSVMVIVIAGAVGLVLWQLGSPDRPTGGTGQATATIDDGQTWFRHDGGKVAPFDYNGKTAYTALIYEADGKQFVGLMTRYRPEAKKAIEDALAARAQGKASAMLEGKATAAKESGLEIKKPGETTWRPWSIEQAGGRPLPAVTSSSGKPASPVTP